MLMIIQDGNHIGADLANADDMTKEWPKLELLLLLGFPASARNSLCRWYWKEKDAVTLAEVFELVISSDRDPRPSYLISKMLDVQCIGIKTFFSVVSHMAELNFGKRCNLVWKNKYKQFLNAHRVKGSRKRSWSFPITDEGKLLAKFRNGAQHLPRRRKKTANKPVEQTA